MGWQERSRRNVCVWSADGYRGVEGDDEATNIPHFLKKRAIDILQGSQYHFATQIDRNSP